MKKYILLGLLLAVISTSVHLMNSLAPIEPVCLPAVLSPDRALPVSTAEETCIHEKRKIQVALLLDTSNSMDGLIEQAKSQLWKLVNEFASVRKDGEIPQVEIALYEYGNDDLSVSQGYVRKIATLTGDLDQISNQLFSLRTNGGQEYCGWVIKDALTQLEWWASEEDLKMIVIAGNEPFDQGPVDFQEFCFSAARRGIYVNTIFCGAYQEGVDTKWKKGADLAKGTYTNIDHNDKVVHVSTPYDQEVLDLNRKLNETYVFYGEEGEVRQGNQQKQDDLSMNYGAANARTRSFVKSKELYRNADWDLVDAVAESPEVLNDSSALPAPMQAMTPEERVSYIEKKQAERQQIKQKLQKIEVQVNEYVSKADPGTGGTKTLDKALIEAVRMQAKARGFEWAEEPGL